MRIITNLRHLGKGFRRPVVGIGIFDGVHIGHKKILKEVIKRARRIKGESVIVTFNPHPSRLLGAIAASPLLISLKHRVGLICKEGADTVCVLNFTRQFSNSTAADFVRHILVSRIGARHVVIGSDFTFGKNRAGDINLLRRMGAKYGFGVTGLPLLKSGNRPVSSTRIRALVMSGKLTEAKRLLGRPASILGTVVEGARRGRLLGYPTANINPHHEAIPPSGVYAVYAVINRRRYRGILNIGRRPTFDTNGSPRGARLAAKPREAEGEPTIEVHVFNFNKTIYGRDIEVYFIKRLRSERKFKNKNGLIKQIKVDEKRAFMLL